MQPPKRTQVLRMPLKVERIIASCNHTQKITRASSFCNEEPGPTSGLCAFKYDDEGSGAVINAELLSLPVCDTRSNPVTALPSASYSAARIFVTLGRSAGCRTRASHATRSGCATRPWKRQQRRSLLLLHEVLHLALTHTRGDPDSKSNHRNWWPEG